MSIVISCIHMHSLGTSFIMYSSNYSTYVISVCNQHIYFMMFLAWILICCPWYLNLALH